MGSNYTVRSLVLQVRHSLVRATNKYCLAAKKRNAWTGSKLPIYNDIRVRAPTHVARDYMPVA